MSLDLVCTKSLRAFKLIIDTCRFGSVLCHVLGTCERINFIEGQ